MLVSATVCWLAALLLLAYDAGGNAVARRIGPLSYRAVTAALPLWKLAISAFGPWVGYASLILAAYFAFEFWGLLALVIAWFLAFRASAMIWARGVYLGTIEIRDFVLVRWFHLTIGAVTAAAAVFFALAAI